MSRSQVSCAVSRSELVLRELVSVGTQSSSSATEFVAYRKRKSGALVSGPSPKDMLPAVFEGLRRSVRAKKCKRIGRQVNASARAPELRSDALC